jgi:hypothetical protein
MLRKDTTAMRQTAALTPLAHRATNDSLAPPASSAAESRRLIVAAPAVALLARWRADLAVLEQHTPNSDVLLSLATCTAELAEAIDRGSETPLDIALSDARALSKISLRQLQRICQTTPERIGAKRYGRKWYLDSTKFETYLVSHDRDNRPP